MSLERLAKKSIKQGREDDANNISDNDDDFATAGNQRHARGQHRVS